MHVEMIPDSKEPQKDFPISNPDDSLRDPAYCVVATVTVIANVL